MPRPASIRDRLEADAWKNHPRFARRLARRPARLPRKPLAWQDRALLIIASVLVLLLILRMETAQADEDFWGLEFVDATASARTMALDTRMDVRVTGMVARVTVTQLFRNDGSAWAEAVYRFPLPPGSAVDRLRIRAGQRLIEGEIREKQDAARQYRQALSDGRVASLVNQERANQFKTSLANIGPGEEIAVTIGFLVRVDYREGRFTLRLPMTFTGRYDGGLASGSLAPAPLLVNGGSGNDHRLSLEVDLRSGLELERIESRYHDVDIHPTLKGYRVFLADPGDRPDRAFELEWAPGFGAAPSSSLAAWAGPDAVYAMLMLAPPLAEAVAPRAREVIFVIDTSGSMEGISLEQARAALLQGLEFLRPDDRFNLIRFSSGHQALFNESRPPEPAELAAAADFIAELNASGGTEMGPALERAMDLPEQPGLMRQIVFVTDGSVGNETELLLQIGEQLGASRLFPVSIGSAPNSWFMRKSAEIGRGVHTHIGRSDEVTERIAELWSRIENPAVENLCVDWGMEAEYYPEIIPDLYAGEPLWLLARLPREPTAVTLCGELDGRAWELESRLRPGAGSEDLAALWARSKIEALEDSRIFGADPLQTREEILALALEFDLLTPYSSLVAVDRSPARPESEGLERQDVPSLLPAGGSAASGFSRTATGWPLQLALSLFTLFLATGMLLYSPPSRKRLAGGARPPVTTPVP